MPEVEPDPTPRYKRILLKLSGEVLAGGAGFGIDAGRVRSRWPKRSPKWPGGACSSAW